MVNDNEKRRGGYGNLARSPESNLTEAYVKNASILLRDTMNRRFGRRFRWERKLDKTSIPGGESAFQPDGGIFYLDGKIILALEAKRQENCGNAHERWCKNFDIFSMVAPDATYLTFFSGGAAVKGGVAWNGLHYKHWCMKTNTVLYNTIPSDRPQATFMAQTAHNTDFVYDRAMETVEMQIARRMGTHIAA